MTMLGTAERIVRILRNRSMFEAEDNPIFGIGNVKHFITKMGEKLLQLSVKTRSPARENGTDMSMGNYQTMSHN
jgi:hypothetical protein